MFLKCARSTDEQFNIQNETRRQGSATVFGFCFSWQTCIVRLTLVFVFVLLVVVVVVRGAFLAVLRRELTVECLNVAE